MTAADGVVRDLTLLHGDGALGRRFNIVIVAEGYRERDAGRFEDDAAAVTRAIVGGEPFASHERKLNVLRLDVWSTEAGAARAGVRSPRTYFDAAFALQPERLLVVDVPLVLATVRAQMLAGPTHAHQVLVLVNTDEDGGAGGAGIAIASRARGARAAVHELGHAFGLGDEYVYRDHPQHDAARARRYPAAGSTIWPNVSATAERDRLRWREQVAAATSLPTVRRPQGPAVTAATVGAFAGAIEPDHFRPQWMCRMRYSEFPRFCAVCAATIDRLLQPFGA